MPNSELVTQWQDSAPDMEYAEWLEAEVEIQRELLDDIAAGDYVGLLAAFAYITDIVVEIHFRKGMQ